MQIYEKNYASGMAIMEENSSHSVRLLFIIFVKRSIEWHQKELPNEPLKMRSKMSSQNRSPLGDENASFCQHGTEGETKPTCSVCFAKSLQNVKEIFLCLMSIIRLKLLG